LEGMAAELLGKDAGLFVPSGVMGNQLAIRLHTRPGDEVIVEATSHLIRYEGGSACSLSGVQLCCVSGTRGLLSPEGVTASIRRRDLHCPPTTLLCLEQTHNVGGGSVYPLPLMERVVEVGRKHGLALHLDGARLFNAVIKTGVSAAEYARHFDTVSFCLSKGLGAPVGSVLVSDRERIAQLRRLRKVFGGGMRQAGILAAAGLYALEHHIDRLAEDHAHAKRLAELLTNIPGVVVNVEATETNMVMFQVPEAMDSTDTILRKGKEGGVLFNAVGDRAFRLVTHLDVNKADIEAAGKIFSGVLARSGV